MGVRELFYGIINSQPKPIFVSIMLPFVIIVFVSWFFSATKTMFPKGDAAFLLTYFELLPSLILLGFSKTPEIPRLLIIFTTLIASPWICGGFIALHIIILCSAFGSCSLIPI